jgi:hypothetical protein
MDSDTLPRMRMAQKRKEKISDARGIYGVILKPEEALLTMP